MVTTIQPELIPKTDQNWKQKEDSLAPVTPLSLMQIALERGQVEQLQILQDMHFKQMARDAEIEFNLAMNAVQSEITRVVPDAYNKQTQSKWATYPALDKVLRPLYTKHGFSLSFDSGDSAPETVVAYCFVSHRAGHTRKYQSPAIPADGKGAKGGDVMTKTHATGSAMSYGMRYLLKFIFNIAVGEDDDDGNQQMSGLSEKLEWIANCKTLSELKRIFDQAYNEAEELGDKAAMFDLIKANSLKRKELTPKEQPK